MKIETVHLDDVTVVTPAGELDAHTAAEIRHTLIGLVDHGHIRLVVDLGRVPYLDSSGLGAIVAAMKHARAADGDLVLCAPQDNVRAILDMTGLARQIAVHADRKAGVAAAERRSLAVRLEVSRAEFLVSTRDSAGHWTTVADTMVPLQPGRSSYRWRIRLKEAKVTAVALKEILTAPTPPGFWPSGPGVTIENEGRTAITERTVEVKGGWVSNSWRVVKGDQPGEYAIDVHLNGAFVRRFMFYLG